MNRAKTTLNTIVVFLLLPLSLTMLLTGCIFSSGGRKDYLEGQLPALVTQDLQAKTTSKTGSTDCQSVDLILDAPGHYVGKAHLADGTQRKITVFDEGTSFRFEMAPAN